MKRDIFLGNEAIALGLLEGGCQVITSYPGTPSSEILPSAVKFIKDEGLPVYTEWSTNEKVALDTAFAAAISGKRAVCCMKQVGLNVAADSLMSSAYLGTTGALLIISCDDPGPHSSQTEQDSRFMARLAKIPVFDPSTPQEAREMAAAALDLSEEFHVPVLLRPAIRVCHARQSISWDRIPPSAKPPRFDKDPLRWAATPRYRYMLHKQLNKKLETIGHRFETWKAINFHDLEPGRSYPLGIISGGVPYAVIRDILDECGREDIPVLKIGTPFPFPDALAAEFMNACEKVLVLEETDCVIEYLLGARDKVMGRVSGHVPREGELIPDIIFNILQEVIKVRGLESLPEAGPQGTELLGDLELPVRRPTLCPGCPHRASFFAIRKANPKAIFTSDIGCYTLGINLGGVDTCLDMGAGITMASGFYHAFSQDNIEQPIIATIGDSTFFHSGTAGLLNAIYNDARFILVILDNETTAMTGMQPTPGTGLRADGSKGKAISLERLVKGCGVEFLEVVDPYDINGMISVLKKAHQFVKSPDGGLAVIIARHPCVIASKGKALGEPKRIQITEDCVDCNFCIERFECPALVKDKTLERTVIDEALCSGCGVCVEICPKGAIVEVQ